jgi:lipid-A-disaccharide synthase
MIMLAEAFPEEKFILAAISTVSDVHYESGRGIPNLHLVFDRTNDILAFAHAGVITSGTATLETAIWGIPQVVVYKSASWLSFMIARMVVRIKFISLVNLIAGREVVKELIQENLTQGNLVEELYRIVHDDQVRARILQEYSEIRNILGEEPVSTKAASLMTAYLNLKNSSIFPA